MRILLSCITDAVRAARRGHWSIVRLELRTFFRLLTR